MKTRGLRRTRIGVVVSDRMDKSVVVDVSRKVLHPFYKKYVVKRKRLLAHDERNECQVGDKVRVVEARPLSRRKRWRVREKLG